MKLFNLNIKIAALDKFSTTFAQIGSKLDRLGKKASNLGKNLTLGLSAPLAGFGIMAVKRSADFDTLRTALETATGSVDAAKAKFADLQKFAATTPFALEETVQAFIKLKNLGLDPSNEALVAYGNTSGAMGKSLMQMIEAVADASTLEFERLKEFGIRASQQGKYVTFTFQGVKTKVKKDANQIEAYLRQLGMVNFAGGMDKQAKTLGGAFSNLQDSISGALDIIGTDIAKTFQLNARFRAWGDTLNNLANGFNKLPQPIKDFAIYLGFAVVLLGPAVTFIGQMAIGMGILAALAPKVAAGFAAMGLSVAAFTLIAIGVYIIADAFTALSREAGGIGNALKILGGIVVDVLLLPFTALLKAITWVWAKLGTPPAGLKNLKLFNVGAAAAESAVNGPAPVNQGARAALQRQADLQNAVRTGNTAAIEVLFKNPPPGMKASVVENKGSNVTVDQGPAMAGAN